MANKATEGCTFAQRGGGVEEKVFSLSQTYPLAARMVQ